MEKFTVLQAAVLLFFAVYVTGQYGGQDHMLMNNKCKCVKVTSKLVPSKDNPNEEVLERNIEIRIPLNVRVNLSDPTSPIRTNFHYDLRKMCQICDPKEIEIGGETVLVPQGNCDEDEDENDSCYTYDINKCYTSKVPFTFKGKTVMMDVPLNPESCYE